MQFENNGENTIQFFILVPVYKVEKYISACIDSVLNQSYQNFRLILVDDGSPDRSGEICDGYAKMDQRITVIHQKNLGQILARQAAIEYLMGVPKDDNSFALIIDADDSLKQHALESIYKVILEYNCDMIIFGMDHVVEGKVVTPYDAGKGYDGIILDKRILYKRVFCHSEYNPVWRKAIACNLLSNIDYSRYYFVSRTGDLLLSISYYKNCSNAYFLNESLYNYTYNPNGITHTYWTKKNFKVDFTVPQIVMEFLLQENVFDSSDWKQYRASCIRNLLGEMRRFCSFPISRKEKKGYFNEIHSSEYFKLYIKNQEYDEKCLGVHKYRYRLFLKKTYWPIILYEDIRRSVRFLLGENICRSIRHLKLKLAKG